MSKRNKNVQVHTAPSPSPSVPAQSAVSVHPSPAVKAPTASIQPSVAKPKAFVSRVKAWTWRLTATYFWLHSILIVMAGRDPLSGIETAITMKAVTLLSFLGFAPVNVGHLPLVFLAIWLLAITTFSPTQLLLGLPIYVSVFPFTALIVFIYRDTLKAASAADASAPTPQPARHFPLASFSIAMLVGWLVCSLWRLIFAWSQSGGFLALACSLFHARISSP